MHDARRKQLRTIRQLATFLRGAAPRDATSYYAKIMNAAADDLDKTAQSYDEEWRDTDQVDEALTDQAAASPSDVLSPTALAPPFATPTIAGRSSRSCST
jgi:hypothetical protein